MDENLNNLINTQYPQSPVDFNTPFVPPAQPITPPKPKVIATSKPARKEFMKQSMNLSKMLSSLGEAPKRPEEPTLDNTKNDPYMQMLNQRSVLDDEITRSLISSINANKYQRENEVRQQYDRYTRGLELLGIQSGSARYTPELFAGKIQEAEMQKLSKLREFDVEANKALLEAKQAQASGQLNILREKMNRIKELKSERDNYLKNLASNIQDQTTIAEAKAKEIYSSLQTLNEADKEEFLNAVADRFGIPVSSLVAQVAEITQGKTKKGGTGTSSSKKLSFTQRETLRNRYPELADKFVEGITEAEAEALITGGGGDVAEEETTDIDFETLADELDSLVSEGSWSQKDLFNLALELGVKRNRGNKKQSEIDTLLENVRTGIYTQEELLNAINNLNLSI